MVYCTLDYQVEGWMVQPGGCWPLGEQEEMFDSFIADTTISGLL